MGGHRQQRVKTVVAPSGDTAVAHGPGEEVVAGAPASGRGAPLPWHVKGAARLRKSISDYPAVYAAVIALGVWAVMSTRLPPRILPSPLAVAESFAYQLQIGALPVYVWSSLSVLITAAVIGVTVGIPLGFLIGSTRTASRMLTPMVGFLYAISGIAWIPMFIIWFGFTRTTVMAVVNYSLLFPVIYNTALGVRSVRPVFRHAALTLGASRLRVIRDVLVPGAMPNMVTGIRVGVAYGWRGLIAGELLIASPGIGYMLFDARAAQDTATIIAGMIVIGLSWLVMDRVFMRPIETQTVERWGLVEKAS